MRKDKMKKTNSPRKIKEKIGNEWVELEVLDENELITVNPNTYDKILNKRSESEKLGIKELILLLLGVDPDIPLKLTLLMKEAFLIEKELSNVLEINFDNLDFYPIILDHIVKN